MSANLLKIKRSTTSATPVSLAQGELAYSEVSKILFIGEDAANIRAIGGEGHFVKKGGDTVTGDLVISGNLYVQGQTTTVDSNTISLGDNILVLNNDLSITDTPTQNAGIEINRGSQAAVQWVWNEAGDYWGAQGGNLGGITDITISGDFDGANLNLAGGALVGVDLDVLGNTTTGTLNAGTTVLGGTSATSLTVSGATTVNGLFTTRGIDDNASQNVLTLNVDRTASFYDDVSVGGALSITQGVTVGTTADITGNTTIGGTLSLTGNATLSAGLTVGGATALNSSLTVTGATSLAGLTAGASTLSSLTVSGTAAISGATTTADLTVNGFFTSRGINDDATSTKITIANGQVTIAPNTVITGSLTAGASTLASLGVTANATVGGTLGVTGQATFTANANFSQDIVGNGVDSEVMNFIIDGGTF
jgi:cytoskeletal protein CcmA (bactofilin family)